jgi:hypothetical protein
MSIRTNTAVWIEKYNRWQIKVQKDGVRKTFTSTKPGRTGQRECNKKADDFLEHNIEDRTIRVSDASEKFLNELMITTSQSNWKPCKSYLYNYLLPNYGHRKVESLTAKDFQTIINYAYSKGLAKKTLKT